MAQPALQPLGRLADVAHQDHLVGFYDSDSYLNQTLVHFVAPGLTAGEMVMVIATQEHCRDLEDALRGAGFDVAGLGASGRLTFSDATELLPRIMVDGRPDAARLRRQTAARMDQAEAEGRRTRIYGEMVALLLEHGNLPGVLLLEELWDELVSTRPLTLFCAYPLRAFDREESGEAFHLLCDAHTAVLPSGFYAEIADSDARHRAVAILQHEAIVGINERVALREELHAQRAELQRLRALDRIRTRLVAALVGELPRGPHEVLRRPRRDLAVEAIAKTACRQVRAVLGASRCTFQPGRPGVITNDGPEVLVPVADDRVAYGVLCLLLAQPRALEEGEMAFLREVAGLLAVALAHDARADL